MQPTCPAEMARKVLILDGTASNRAPHRRIPEHVTARLDTHGCTVSHFALAELRLAPCQGDFECWTRTPGQCRTRDEIQDIAPAFMAADLVILITPIVFGGYSAALKGALDRLLGIIHPCFRERAGLTRHHPRYARYPTMLFIGLADVETPETTSIFKELAGGNAINLQAPSYRALVVTPPAPTWPDKVDAAIEAALAGQPGDALPFHPAADALAQACRPDPRPPVADRPPRQATILIGSTRPAGESTSESLARALMAELTRAGIDTQLVRAISFVKDGRRAEEALAAMRGGELLIIAAPLYVDGLPALATRALERLHASLAEQPHPLRQVVGLLNCGYPEAAHNRSAMRLLRAFAHQAGLSWAGGLAMGAGELLHGRPLSAAPFLLRAQIRALASAGAALAAGQAIPTAASEAMATPVAPAFLFRWLAALRWATQARARGLGWRALAARPHDQTASG